MTPRGWGSASGVECPLWKSSSTLRGSEPVSRTILGTINVDVYSRLSFCTYTSCISSHRCHISHYQSSKHWRVCPYSSIYLTNAYSILKNSNLFHITESSSAFNKVTVALMCTFNWKRITLVHILIQNSTSWALQICWFRTQGFIQTRIWVSGTHTYCRKFTNIYYGEILWYF